MQLDELAIALPLLATAALYGVGVRGGHTGLRRWEVLCFAGGWLTLAVALISPLHELSESLFSAHMLQHELLMIVAAPLLILGRPLVPFLWALPFAGRRRLGSIAKAPAMRRLWAGITAPFAAWMIHAIVLWGWHIPRLFDATITSDAVHAAQHISFLGSALLFWWALLRRQSGYGMAVLYVFTTAVHTTILGALLTFSPRPWYSIYADRTAAYGLTPLEDQQIGGLIMWVPAGVVFIIAGLILFAKWLKESDSRAFVWTAKISAALVLCALLAACRGQIPNQAAVLSGGNPQRGKAKIQYYGCPACHTIPGIRGADGLVGPPLSHIASRVYVGGGLPNTPENLIRWIRNPKAVDQLAAMPNMNVSASDARDIAGYLYTLE